MKETILVHNENFLLLATDSIDIVQKFFMRVISSKDVTPVATYSDDDFKNILDYFFMDYSDKAYKAAVNFSITKDTIVNVLQIVSNELGSEITTEYSKISFEFKVPSIPMSNLLSVLNKDDKIDPDDLIDLYQMGYKEPSKTMLKLLSIHNSGVTKESDLVISELILDMQVIPEE